MPPMVQRAWVEGSTGKNSPCGRSAAFSWPSTRPGSTSAVRASASTCEDAAQMLGAVDHQRPVDRLAALAVPPPRGSTGTPSSRAIASAAATSSIVSRHDHADRLDLVDRGVGRVAAARLARSNSTSPSILRAQPRRRGARVARLGCVAAVGGTHGAITWRRAAARGVRLAVTSACSRHRCDKLASAASAAAGCPIAQGATMADSSQHAGRHFLQIPGPTNVPDRVLRAIDKPTMDHRGPEFGELGQQILGQPRAIFQTERPVIIYPASGTGAWEAALVNTLSPGDTVLMCRTGWFATLWQEMAERLGLRAGCSSRPTGGAARMSRRSRHALARGHGAPDQGGLRGPQRDLDRLRHRASMRCARRSTRAGHPALLLVDTISSLGLDRLPARRMGRRRHGRRLAEGPDAAAGPVVQRDQRRRRCGRRDRPAAAQLLGLAGDAGGERDRLLSLHARDQPALRAERGDRDAARRRGWRTCSPATTATPRRPAAPCAPGGWRSSAPIRGTTRRRDRGAGAGGPQRRRAARD